MHADARDRFGSDTDTRADRHERKRRCLILRFGADNKIDACSRQGAQNSICEARPISGWEQDERTPDKIGKPRSEEHTSELQSLMRISYAVFCLKKKKQHRRTRNK